MKRVFIDGAAGTTGLRIYERMGARADIELISLSDELRKDAAARKEALNSCDAAFLCLPDAAAIEAVAMIEDPAVVVFDTSTAHRTEPNFTYGFPELDPKIYEKLKTAKRIAVPGCHASGFIALAEPLVKAGLIPKDAHLSCHSITGYSGGGKKMIAQYEDKDRDKLLKAPRQYGVSQNHKHLKEMKYVTGLETAPVFCPIVADFYSGMEVTIPLFTSDINGTAEDIAAVYKETYKSGLVFYKENAPEDGFMSALAMSGRDSMEISVEGNSERILLIARFDNLGKGASGAAVQCMNIALGFDEKEGLVL